MGLGEGGSAVFAFCLPDCRTAWLPPFLQFCLLSCLVACSVCLSVFVFVCLCVCLSAVSAFLSSLSVCRCAYLPAVSVCRCVCLPACSSYPPAILLAFESHRAGGLGHRARPVILSLLCFAGRLNYKVSATTRVMQYMVV